MKDGNSLKQIHLIEDILKNYRPNGRIIDLLNDTKLVLLSAPTAAGRNTMIKQLIMTGKYHYLVSDTTRMPRVNNGVIERNGSEYWFKSEQEFMQGLKNGNYVEAAIIHDQQLSGINIDELHKAYDSQKIAITDIDIHGCDSIVHLSNSVMPVFILPPDFEEWMNRLDGRGKMDAIEKKRRIKSAAKEIRLALQRSYFKFIVNWDLRIAVEELHEHIISKKFNETEQKIDILHARKLLNDLELYLQKN